jgi:CRP-like cAMP-binding protein
MSVINRIKKLGDFSDESLLWLDEHSEVIQFKKGQCLLEFSEICDNLYYINKGMLCGYYHLEDRGV